MSQYCVYCLLSAFFLTFLCVDFRTIAVIFGLDFFLSPPMFSSLRFRFDLFYLHIAVAPDSGVMGP